MTLLEETKDILSFLGKPYNNPLRAQVGVITPEQFIATYQQFQERMSSSKSGWHVGHYKAALDNWLLTELRMMSIPYQTGFSPNSWHKIIDVMLEKEVGNPKVHWLQIVALLESDFNQSHWILIACRLSHHMEDNSMVPDMQHGSRPSKMCISPVINKVLTYNIVCQTKVSGAFIEHDAIWCYDKLVNALVLQEL
jgi:hypothetical protein